MSLIQFSVAKYIADRRRLEPRNIGIIAWHAGIVCGRFAGELNGTLKPPRLVDRDARKAYMRVIESWRLQFDKPSLPVGRGRPDVLRSSPEFMAVLSRFSQENFVIVDGGVVGQTATGATLSNVVDGLFAEMVDDSNGRDGRHRTSLITQCDSLLEPLQRNERFVKEMPVMSKSLEREFPFSYGFGDPMHPDVLLQAVSLTKDDQVDSAAMKFRCVSQDDHLIDKSKCACLVSDHGNSKQLRNKIIYLQKYCEIISINDPAAASRQLRSMGLPMSM